MKDFDLSLRHTLSVSEWLPMTLPSFEGMMPCQNEANCSWHGDCFNGECACLVQYTGGSCSESNLGYFIAFGSIFGFLCVVALIQLILCVKNEYIRQRQKSLKEAAFKITAQKLLYVLIIVACFIRGVYFFTKEYISELASTNLWAAYYPILLSCFSFLVCFWAEAFHLDIECERPRFLSKSFIGFLVFNVLIYSVLCVQLLLIDTSTDADYTELVKNITNGCFAGMMILAVVFFLIYGIEVYFKVRGAFRGSDSHVDPLQLHMSRVGLVTQAMLQLTVALFLVSDIAKETWLENLPVISQNLYDIIFRVTEFGLALWFPCVLWNCKSPEDLWVLNPKKLFKTFRFLEDKESDPIISKEFPTYGTCDNGEYRVKKNDCWICYDPERTDAGPLIQPCNCKGDVASVHHECLKKWLIECMDNDDFKCKVCKSRYQLQVGWTWVPKGLKPKHWVQTFFILIIMVGCPFAAYAVTHTVTQTYVNVLVIGLTLLLNLTCMKFLVSNLGTCYRRGRLSTISIVGRQVSCDNSPENQGQSNSVIQHSKPIDNSSESSTEGNQISLLHSPDLDPEDRNPSRELGSARSCSISIEAVIENRN